jgi:hypothetical protein
LTAPGRDHTAEPPGENVHSGHDGEQPPTLFDVLGGRRSTLDATVPTACFVVALFIADRWDPEDKVPIALAVGIGSAVAVAVWRAVRGHKPKAAVLGLLPVLGGTIIAARTGRAEDFFLLRILANAASALVWTAGNWVGRPLLGVVVGSLLRQRGAWRRDPDLYRAYARASWWWAASFFLRTAVFAALWAVSAPIALGVAQLALSWPLITVVLFASWQTIRRALPPGHPGILHPRPPST